MKEPDEMTEEMKAAGFAEEKPAEEKVWPGPYISMGEVALLTVSDVNRIGAFLDNGLPKELMLPYAEQKHKVKKGEKILAAMYTDKSGREAATMDIYPHLRTDSPYRKGQTVEGIAYDTSRNFGVFVAVRGKIKVKPAEGAAFENTAEGETAEKTVWYSGLIPAREIPDGIKPGDEVTARVSEVKPDGKLTLSVREKAYRQMGKDEEMILSVIRDKYHGTLPFDDKADPETIRETFGLSKAAFKRAVGGLYKERKIDFLSGKICLLKR